MGEEISTRDLIEQGFESVNLRIDDQVGHLRRDMHRMHSENSDRLDLINGRVGKAHERIAIQEEVTRRLGSDFQGIRDRWHKFRDSIQDVIGRLQDAINKLANGNGSGSSEERPITRKELGWVIALIVGCITIGAVVTIWILKVAAP